MTDGLMQRGKFGDRHPHTRREEAVRVEVGMVVMLLQAKDTKDCQ